MEYKFLVTVETNTDEDDENTPTEAVRRQLRQDIEDGLPDVVDVVLADLTHKPVELVSYQVDNIIPEDEL